MFRIDNLNPPQAVNKGYRIRQATGILARRHVAERGALRLPQCSRWVVQHRTEPAAAGKAQMSCNRIVVMLIVSSVVK